MSAPGSRRGFLRGLTTLPLIGGGVMLTGRPTGAGVPVTPGMLATYSNWLYRERKYLMYASCMDTIGDSGFVPCGTPADDFHHRHSQSYRAAGLEAQQRAAVILSAAGCPLTDEEAEREWGGHFVPMAGIRA